MNQDGLVNTADAQLFTDFNIGKITAFPACQKKSPCSQSGDVNGNTFVNQRDVLMIQDYILQKITLSADQKIRADVNPASGNGVIDIFDTLSLQDYIQGKQSSLPVCTAPPSITVFSPNGGEQWPIGSTQTIRWNTASKGGTVSIAILDYNKTTGDTNFTPYTITDSTNNNSYTWVVPSTFGGASSIGNNYKLLIGGYFWTDPGADRPGLIQDTSDAPFSIVAQ